MRWLFVLLSLSKLSQNLTLFMKVLWYTIMRYARDNAKHLDIMHATYRSRIYEGSLGHLPMSLGFIYVDSVFSVV